MKKNFAAFAFFLLFFGAIPVSCDILCRDSCGCGHITRAPEFTIKEFQTDDISLETTFDPEVFYPKGYASKVIKVSGFEFLSQSKINKKSFGLIQNSFACDPSPSKSLESISEINLINKTEWVSFQGGTIPIGANINHNFIISDYYQYTNTTISNLLSSDYHTYLDEVLYLIWHENLPGELNLIFDIEIKLSDGRVFLFEDEIMKIKN